MCFGTWQWRDGPVKDIAVLPDLCCPQWGALAPKVRRSGEQAWTCEFLTAGGEGKGWDLRAYSYWSQ